jgi:hypothetical protein
VQGPYLQVVFEGGALVVRDVMLILQLIGPVISEAQRMHVLKSLCASVMLSYKDNNSEYLPEIHPSGLLRYKDNQPQIFSGKFTPVGCSDTQRTTPNTQPNFYTSSAHNQVLQTSTTPVETLMV